jgi:hypothetical protein
MLYGGFLVNNKTSLWPKYLSFFQYTIESLTTNELAGRVVIFDPPRFVFYFISLVILLLILKLLGNLF